MTELSPIATMMDNKDLFDENNKLIESRLVKKIIFLFKFVLF